MRGSRSRYVQLSYLTIIGKTVFIPPPPPPPPLVCYYRVKMLYSVVQWLCRGKLGTTKDMVCMIQYKKQRLICIIFFIIVIVSSIIIIINVNVIFIIIISFYCHVHPTSHHTFWLLLHEYHLHYGICIIIILIVYVLFIIIIIIDYVIFIIIILISSSNISKKLDATGEVVSSYSLQIFQVFKA